MILKMRAAGWAEQVFVRLYPGSDVLIDTRGTENMSCSSNKSEHKLSSSSISSLLTTVNGILYGGVACMFQTNGTMEYAHFSQDALRVDYPLSLY